MKKIYNAPKASIYQLNVQDGLLQAISGKGLSNSINMSETTTSGSSRVKENAYDVWDDDWSN